MIANTRRVCVCVCSNELRVWGDRITESKPPDGGLCVFIHMAISIFIRSQLLLTVLYFASRSVSKPNKFTSTLLVDWGWS